MGIKGERSYPGWEAYTGLVDEWLATHNPRNVKTRGKQLVLKLTGKRGLAAAQRVLS